jgi:hypothetical protein
MVRITARRTAALAVSGALAAAGVIALTAGTAGAATSKAVPQCGTSALSADFQLQPNVGDRPEAEGVALIMVTNHSKKTCSVRGYVGLGYVDANGKKHSAATHRTAYVPVRTITLRPKATAFAGANFVSQPYGCTTATKALVTPPNQTTSLTTPFLSALGGGKTQPITLCGNSFNLTDLAPSASDIGIFS